jgi:hypothetical protein
MNRSLCAAVVGFMCASWVPALHADEPGQGVFLTGFVGLNLADADGSSFDPGFRADLTLGTDVYVHDRITIGVGAEVGLIYNAIYKLGDDRANGDLYQFPFLAKAIFSHTPNEKFSKLMPYLALGGGGVHGWSDGTVNLPGDPVDLDGSDTDPAFQGEVGFRLKVSNRTSIGAAHKALIIFSDGDQFYNHSVGLSLTCNL